ncbi:MAG: hypothetical protein IKV96_01230 [Firmicutes bacterium]|nr:hypothetical protein [Bacillota bacterium]
MSIFGFFGEKMRNRFIKERAQSPSLFGKDDDTSGYAVTFRCSGGKSVKAELCVFCINMEDITGRVKCTHYDKYQDGCCERFQVVDDQTERLAELLNLD